MTRAQYFIHRFDEGTLKKVKDLNHHSDREKIKKIKELETKVKDLNLVIKNHTEKNNDKSK